MQIPKELETSDSLCSISTITATASLNVSIDVEKLYYLINIEEQDSEKEGFTYAEFGRKNHETLCKGFHKKMTIMHRKRVEGKRFDKQITVLIRKAEEPGKMFYTNAKIFYNGNIQMTGLKSNEQGFWVLNKIIDTLKKTSDVNYAITDYKVQLINSDFKIDFNVDRDILSKIITENYKVYCSYESCIYPGVKIQYNWNSINTENDGVCKCNSYCNGKGDGYGHTNCKRVTIIVFQSGSIIITGSKNTKQINDAYHFINKIINDNKSQLMRQNVYHQQPSYQPKIKYKKSESKKKIQIPFGYVYDSSTS